MNYPYDYESVLRLSQIHRDELRKEAENYRLANLARRPARPGSPLASELRWRFGKALVRAGSWLIAHAGYPQL